MKRFVILTVSMMILLPAYLVAEGNQVEKKTTTMEEVVVTATKTVEARKDIPNAVILKDELDIQESPAESLGELLSNEPGIDWRTYGNYGGATETINIRGMRSDETQVLVNGLRINSPSLGIAEVGRLPLNNIERIEVVKGAGSVLYGSGAMAGTVNVITKRPKRDQTILKASATIGTESTYQLSAEQGMFAFGDFGYYLTANKIETDGFRSNGDLDHEDASVKLVFDKGDILDVSLYGAFIDREFGLPSVEPGSAYGDHFVNGVKFYNRESASLVNHGSDEDFHAVLKVESVLNDWLSISLQGNYLDLENENNNRNNAGSWTSAAGEGIRSVIENRILEAEGHMTLTPMDGFKLLLGGDYEDLDWDTASIDLDVAGMPKSGSKTTNGASIHTKGVYTEAQYRPCQYFKITAGVRQEKHSTFGSETIPRYGMVLNATESTAIKVSHGKHFKAPTPNDLFWPEDDFARGNPDLKPQTGWHTDVTLEQELLDDRLFLEISYFDWDVDDKIEWAPNPNFIGPFGPKWTPTNVTKSNGRGFEAGIKFQMLPSLNMALSYTYNDAEDELETVTRNAQYTPEHLIKGDLTYFTDSGLTAKVTVRYTSEREYFRSNFDSTPSDVFDEYTTVDLKLDQLFFEHWRVSVQANNLFDEGYETFAEQFLDGNGNYVWSTFPGAEQAFFLTVAYEY